MKPNDHQILEAESIQAVIKTCEAPVPAVSLIIQRSNLDHEIVITADELVALLEACEPDRSDSSLRASRDEEVGKLILERESLSDLLSSLRTERDGLKARLDPIDPGGSDKIDELESSINFLRAERDDALAEVEKLKSMLQDTISRFNDTLSRQSSLVEQVDCLCDERDAALAEVERFKDELHRSTLALHHTIEERDKAVADRNSIEQQAQVVYKVTTEELDKAVAEVAELKAQRQFSLDVNNDTYKRLTASRDALSAQVAALRERVLIADVASCTCQAKTPEPQYHTERCPHRVYMELLALTPSDAVRQFADMSEELEITKRRLSEENEHFQGLSAKFYSLQDKTTALAADNARLKEDKERLDWLATLLKECPHAIVAFNDDPDIECDETESGLMPIGFRISVDGCQGVICCVGDTLDSAIDAARAALTGGAKP